LGPTFYAQSTTGTELTTNDAGSLVWRLSPRKLCALIQSWCIDTSRENGRLSDQNRIAADTRVSNRIKIGRNKW